MNKEEARILHGLFYNRGVGERVSYSAGELNWLPKKSFREGAKWRGQSLESAADKHLASIGATSAAAARPLAYLQGQGYIKYEKELGWFLIEVTASGADIARELHTLWGRANILYKQHKDGVLWFLATVLVSLLTALGVRLSA